MPCQKCTEYEKCNCFSLTMKIAIWCFDDWLKCLEKYDSENFFFHIEKIALWKIKLLELEAIVFRDLNDSGQKGKFRLNDNRIIFKQIDEVMWDISRYSIPFKNIWRIIRFHRQWLRFVDFPLYSRIFTEPRKLKIINVVRK